MLDQHSENIDNNNEKNKYYVNIKSNIQIKTILLNGNNNNYENLCDILNKSFINCNNSLNVIKNILHENYVTDNIIYNKIKQYIKLDNDNYTNIRYEYDACIIKDFVVNNNIIINNYLVTNNYFFLLNILAR